MRATRTVSRLWTRSSRNFSATAGVVVQQDPAFQEADKAYAEAMHEAQVMRDEIANLEEQKELLSQAGLDRSDSFLNRFGAPA